MPRKKQINRKRKMKNKNKINLKGDKEVNKTGQARKQAVIYRGIGIPAEFYTKLKYAQTIAFNTFPFQEHLFRLNSVFDPDWTGGGGQPMYLDEFSLLYSKYCVHACDIQLTFVNKTASTEAAYQKVGVYALADTNLSTSINQAIERDNCVFGQLGPNTGDQGILNMSMFGKINNFLGLPKDENNDNDISAYTSSDPNLVPYAHVWCGSLDNATVSNVYCTVTMTFYVKFFNRINVGRS